MSPIHVVAALALSVVALLASSAFAQSPPTPTVETSSNDAGGDSESKPPTCLPSGSSSRARRNCTPAQTILRTEQEFKTSIEVPALPSSQCEATSETEYQQRNDVARVISTIAIADCKAASGTFTVSVRIRDESGQEKTLEFDETWQRADDQDVHLTADYPIGANVELRRVRVRGLRCTCAEAAPGN
jgi:hypothetical protein